MRHRKRLAIPALLFTLGVLLSGCSNVGGSGETPGAPETTVGANTDLSISIKADGKAESAQYHLLCSGAEALASSEHPQAQDACLLLASEPQLLTEAKDDGAGVCTMQYGGPAIAEVSGTLDGIAVSRRFDLADGCGIAVWTQALPLLVKQPKGQ